MTNELARIESPVLVPWDQMDDTRKGMLKSVCSGSSLNDAQFALLCEIAIRSGLDPFRRQIYGLILDGKFAVLTGIDGLRSVAESTGRYAGSDDPVWEYDEKNAEAKRYPIKATVTVWRLAANGERYPFTATAHWGEYARWYNDKQTNERRLQKNWMEKPKLMLAKCAEALALRKAFPAKLGGLLVGAEVDVEARGHVRQMARSHEHATSAAELLAPVHEAEVEP